MRIGRITFGVKGITPAPAVPAAPMTDAHAICSDPELRGLPTMPVVYHVCDTCGPAIVNDDYSALELHQDTDADCERMTAFVELVGYLADAGMVTKAGYWECEACDQVCIGSAHALETVA